MSKTYSRYVNKLRARSAGYTLRGESMIDDQIEDGDLVLIQPRLSIDDGALVIALINGEQATMKRLYREPHHLRLQPAHA
ncbi:MAG: S24 family peptidase [Lamprobacter sp.]|uniref:LexA family protein n=1 Tax=Lamprobacter sp. TaxID=3100796 RepID=UPI002B256A70|nr:S24 family peptidase [Lamprobacter sp.]MEA3642564.1 S24 family peptidase [Lamprobacter sp.]